MGVQHTPVREVQSKEKEASQDGQEMASGAGKVRKENEKMEVSKDRVSDGGEMKEVGRETRSRSRSIKGNKVGLGLDGKAEQRCEDKEKDLNRNNNVEIGRPSTDMEPNSKVDRKGGAISKINKDVAKEVGKTKGARTRDLGDNQGATGSHSHVQCSNRDCNEWIVSKDFNLNNFNKVEIKKINIYCYRCLSINNERKDVQITDLQVRLSELEKKLIEKERDREMIVLLEHQLLKLSELMQGRGPCLKNLERKDSRQSHGTDPAEWPSLNEACKQNKDHDERYALKARQKTQRMERKELIENSLVTGSGRTEENGESKDSERSVASGQETDTLDRPLWNCWHLLHSKFSRVHSKSSRVHSKSSKVHSKINRKIQFN